VDPIAHEPGDAGLATLEWILLIGAIVVPAAFVIYEIMRALGEFYAFNSWVIALPFP
jgi:hypothetical protein